MNLLHRISAFFLLGCLAATTAFAQEYPKVSTDANEHWYYIRFMRTGNVLEAQADGATCRTVRASFALYNTKEEIDILAAGIERVSRMF